MVDPCRQSRDSTQPPSEMPSLLWFTKLHVLQKLLEFFLNKAITLKNTNSKDNFRKNSRTELAHSAISIDHAFFIFFPGVVRGRDPVGCKDTAGNGIWARGTWVNGTEQLVNWGWTSILMEPTPFSVWHYGFPVAAERHYQKTKIKGQDSPT